MGQTVSPCLQKLQIVANSVSEDTAERYYSRLLMFRIYSWKDIGQLNIYHLNSGLMMN
jgi:hypothetical protein